MHVEEKDERDSLFIRDTIVVAFFCRRPYAAVARAFGQAFEVWLAQTPQEAKRWAIVGPHGDEYKAVTPRTVPRGRAEFDPERAKTRDMSSLEIGGPQEINGEWHFGFTGNRDLEGDITNVLEIRTPTTRVEADPDRYVEFVLNLAKLLPYDSGYASPALVWGVDSQQIAFARIARQWAFKHPGFDMPDNGASSFALGSKLRGAYWLTFVGPDALLKLGGGAALRSALPTEVEIQPAGVGVMLRLSRMPEVGDVNRMDNLPVVRATAKVLEPVSRFGDRLLNNNFIDDDERARWERRHLD